MDTSKKEKDEIDVIMSSMLDAINGVDAANRDYDNNHKVLNLDVDMFHKELMNRWVNLRVLLDKMKKDKNERKKS